MRSIFLILSLFPFFTSCNPTSNSTPQTNPNTQSENYNNPDNDSQYNDQQANYNSSYNSDTTNQSDNYNNPDPDWQTTNRIQTALRNDNSLSPNGRSIDVETIDGVVTLSGIVSSKKESGYIESKVKAINGVRKVNNKLTIKP